jgi:hypothetical protein
MMNTENSIKRTLLTGAGWSQNWGAKVASDLWQLIMDDQAIRNNERLRNLCLEEPSFEVALAKTQTPLFTATDRQDFQNAVMEAFVSTDNAMLHTYNPATWININYIKEMIAKFSDYIFTLNQDLFFERYLWSEPKYFSQGITLPGIRQNPGVAFFRPNMERFSNQFLVQPSGDVGQTQLHGQFNVIKLHGSFNWRMPDGSNVMVVGSEKSRQIADLPLLAWYFDIFRGMLFAGHARLMIVGYGFGDDHVNAIIAEAVEKHRLKVFIWDVGSNLKNRVLAAAHGAVIWKGLLSTCTQRMLEVFPSNQDETEEYRRIRRSFFDETQFWPR